MDDGLPGAGAAGLPRAGAGGFALQSDWPRLVLASSSQSRRALMEAAGLRFTVSAPRVDERAVKQATRAAGGSAEDAAIALANMKADTVRDPEVVAIGCDQILVCGGVWYDKPISLEAARQQLTELRGKTHTLVTAVVCRRGGQRVFRHVEKPVLRMRAFTGPFLTAYLAAEGERVLTSVGAYRLEGLGVHLFESVDGEHSAILGLPMPPLLGFLRQCGALVA